MAELRYESFGIWSKLVFSGKITYEITQKMKGEVEAQLLEMGEGTILVCDLSQVTFLDSSGIGCLVFLNNKMHQKGGSCCLYHPSDVVLKTLDLVQLTTFFDVVVNECDLITRTSG
ncbi:anti-sigma B factor antagonist [Desulfonatronum thiosulfatophilum]|uniref:Anti-sigma B factor antagonist n=1 Tax=Desulfonatronum thiosulfatophilum TaxID=617002 RepID=A0A1G6C9F0_9BACT|nr:STAS domain-containing protein [Desulfonatronum thiosulfatophilum]SDB29503.1 anti-sigma B factor antagonist [Desulfonatronum thiosulfatophilum]